MDTDLVKALSDYADNANRVMTWLGNPTEFQFDDLVLLLIVILIVVAAVATYDALQH